MRISDWSSDVCSSDLLAEDEDGGDPIVEEVRSILDGHIVLSRKLEAAYHYPEIDVLTSLSRVMPRVTEPAHQRGDGQLRKRSEEHTAELQSRMRNSYAVCCWRKRRARKTHNCESDNSICHR